MKGIERIKAQSHPLSPPAVLPRLRPIPGEELQADFKVPSQDYENVLILSTTLSRPPRGICGVWLGGGEEEEEVTECERRRLGRGERWEEGKEGRMG